MACVSVHARQRSCRTGASAPVPSAGLGQVPGVPGTNLTQPQAEEKDCEDRPPLREMQSFPSSRRWKPNRTGIRMAKNRNAGTCLRRLPVGTANLLPTPGDQPNLD